jgi:hypothetical protein
MATIKSTRKSLGVLAAAASAAALPVGDQAHAQMAPTSGSGPWVSFEGGVLFSNFGNTTFPNGAIPSLPSAGFDKVPNGPTTGDYSTHRSNGGYGSFTLGQAIPGGADWRFTTSVFQLGTFKGTGSATNSFTGDFFDQFGSATAGERQRLLFGTIDFDLGHRFNAGTFEFRAFAGVRGIHMHEWIDQFTNSTSDKVGEDAPPPGIFATTSQFSSRFDGAGPRVGIDFQSHATFGFFGSASTAVMFGPRNSSYLTTGSGGPLSVQVQSVDWIGNVSGTFGLMWRFLPNGVLQVGYRADEWVNMAESFSFVGLNQNRNVFTQSPFLRVTVQY